VNYDNSLAVTVTVTCYLWAPSSGRAGLNECECPGQNRDREAP